MHQNDGLTLYTNRNHVTAADTRVGIYIYGSMSNHIDSSTLKLHKPTESIGVLIKYDRWRTAAKDSLSAGILIGSQAISYIAAIIIDIPYWMSSLSDLIGQRGTYSDSPLCPEE